MDARLAIGVLAFVAGVAGAVESTDWPPPPEVMARMRELQSTVADPAASQEERAAAKRELERLMKSPAGAQRRDDGSKRSPRAAIEPFPSVAREMDARMPLPAPPTARLEVITDPPARKPAINPSTGSVVQPTAPGVAVDPRTGHLLHETPAGYVDPRTGQLVPR
jgi:hypothetical protein